MANECPKCQTSNPDESKFCMECATPLPGIQDAVHTKTLETPSEELTRGSVFAGRYEIIEKLGKGGIGIVGISDPPGHIRKVDPGAIGIIRISEL